LDLGNRHLPGRLEEVLDGGLPLVAGVNQLEVFLFRLRFPSCRSAGHFAGAFSSRAGGRSPFPFRGTRSLGSLRLGRGLRIGVARLGYSEESTEVFLFEILELKLPSKRSDEFSKKLRESIVESCKLTAVPEPLM
jgi:hypothetical protein